MTRNSLSGRATVRIAKADIVPTDAKGVKLFCRPSYEMMAEVVGTPFAYPLSSRMDEKNFKARPPEVVSGLPNMTPIFSRI